MDETVRCELFGRSTAGNADANGEPDQVAFGVDLRPTDDRAVRLRLDGRIRQRSFRKQNGEFFTAVSHDDIGGAAHPDDYLGYGSQHDVSTMVTVAVVDGF